MHISNNLYLKKAATRFPDLQHSKRNEIPETKQSDISALPQSLNTQTSYHNIPEGSRNYTTFSVPLLLGSMCFHVDSAAPLIQILLSWISEGKRQPQVDTSERENSEAQNSLRRYRKLQLFHRNAPLFQPDESPRLPWALCSFTTSRVFSAAAGHQQLIDAHSKIKS